MVDPVRVQQMQEMEQVEQCVKLLIRSRNELYIHMRYLDVALSSLGMEADWKRKNIATDGFILYYGPDAMLRLYDQGRGRKEVNRAFFHVLMHCLFMHWDGRRGRDEMLWHVACDMAAEYMIDGWLKPCIRRPPTMFRREWYQRLLHQGIRVMNAESIYHKLEKMELKEKQVNRLLAEFMVDEHDLWEKEKPQSQRVRRQNQWRDTRERMQTELESFGTEDASEADRELLEQVQEQNRERVDYRDFLRKFAVLKEEISVDPDAFDPVFYTFGLERYGNIPLIEPLETKEMYRVEDFVIVLDTSMSCSGELVMRFLEETCSVLSSSESFFRKVNIHIIQCDEKVQSDIKITSREEMQAYMEGFTIAGHGGTDFRPAFEYVRQMKGRGEFRHLKGLIYFTDGKGIYPLQKPEYDTAFVFVEEKYSEISVPGWAMKVVLSAEDLRK